jgi:transcriptional regulator with XRE-family HTH domain
MRNGTHLPNGAEVRRLRVRHGWNQEDLATKVGVGKRTIERIECGLPTTIKVLKFVSEALDVAVESILSASSQLAEGSQCEERTTEIEFRAEDRDQSGIEDIPVGSQVSVAIGIQGIQIRFPDDFETWDRKRQIKVMSAIAKLVGVQPTELDVADLSEGSVLLTLTLTPEQAEKLLWAVKQRELESIGAEDAKLVDVRDPDITTTRSGGVSASREIGKGDDEPDFGALPHDVEKLSADQIRRLVSRLPRDQQYMFREIIIEKETFHHLAQNLEITLGEAELLFLDMIKRLEELARIEPTR